MFLTPSFLINILILVSPLFLSMLIFTMGNRGRKISYWLNLLSCLSYFLSLFLLDNYSLNRTFFLSKTSLLALQVITGFAIISFAFNDKSKGQGVRNTFLGPFNLIGATFLLGAQEITLLVISFMILASTSLFSVSFSRQKYSREATINFFILTSLSFSFLFLFGVFFFGATGGTSLYDFNIHNYNFFGLSLFFLFFVILFNLGCFPFHTWMPAIFRNVDRSNIINIFLLEKGVNSFVFLILFQRLLIELDPKFQNVLINFVLIMAIINSYYGNLVALAQKSLKKQLAYTSISYSSLFLLFVCLEPNVLLTRQLLWAIIIFMSGIVGSIYCLNIFSRQGAVLDEAELLRGRGWQDITLSLTFCFCLASLAGFPLTGGFSTRYILFSQYFSQGLVWESIAILLSHVLTLSIFIRFIMELFLHKTSLYPGNNSNFRTRFVQILFIIVFIGGGLRPFIM